MKELQSQIYEFGDYYINAAQQLLIRRDDDKPIALTPKVFDTLFYLVQNNQRVIEKDELMREIWADTIVEESNLNKNISILRRVLGENKNEHRYIVTIPGRGYKFVAQVRVLNSESQITTKANSQPEPENSGQILNPNSKTQNRLWFVSTAVLSFLALGAAGLFLRRGVEKSAGASVKTVAVLPFKTLVSKNRNEALELGMADTLINKISSSEEIIVRPLSSVRRFNSLEQDNLQAGANSGWIRFWTERFKRPLIESESPRGSFAQMTANNCGQKLSMKNLPIFSPFRIRFRKKY